MTDNSLIQALPEWAAFLRRDGTVLRELGGRRLGMKTGGDLVGKRLADLWPQDVVSQLLPMIGRALRNRGASDGRFASGGRQYEVRIAAQGRHRVLCVIRDALPADAPGAHDGSRSGERGGLERRALFARLGESIAKARLRDRPLAICMVYMDGLQQLGKVLDFGIIEQITATLLRGAAALLADVPNGYVDRLAENILLFVVDDFEDREALQGLSSRLLEFLGQPVAVGDATLSATPSAGLAVLGNDGTEARQLLESARFAMLEARRSGSNLARFYSADLQIRSLARLDLEHELREAIAQDHLALRYTARHCLESGRLVAIHAYLRWTHPVRGEVAAADFLPIADSTGLATQLSRWALTRLQRDIPSFRGEGVRPIRFSFGPLKSHLSSGHLRDDVEVLFASGAIAPEDFEVRIAERALAGLADAGSLTRSLIDLGTTVAVDEFGRGFTSLPRLARLPISALQLDRRLALAASADPTARRAAAAAFAVAKALELVARSAGVDDEPQRRLLNSLGCTEGLGDNFAAVSSAGSDDIGRRRRTA